MSFPDHKALKKLADACRKAGIKHFKNADLEFTLTDDAPVSNYKKKTGVEAHSPVIDPDFKTDSLTQDQLLMWSAIDPMTEPTEGLDS